MLFSCDRLPDAMIVHVNVDLARPFCRRGFAERPVNGVDNQPLNGFDLEIFGVSERGHEDAGASLVLPRPSDGIVNRILALAIDGATSQQQLSVGTRVMRGD